MLLLNLLLLLLRSARDEVVRAVGRLDGGRSGSLHRHCDGVGDAVDGHELRDGSAGLSLDEGDLRRLVLERLLLLLVDGLRVIVDGRG